MRAGVLEQGTVETLEEAGVAARLHRKVSCTTASHLFAGVRHASTSRISSTKVTVYGQTEITHDLMDARKASGAPSVYEAESVSVHEIDGASPTVRYLEGGETRGCS